MQFFMFDTGFIYVYLMKSKSEIPDEVKAFAKEIGVLISLILYPEGRQKLEKVRKTIQEIRCLLNFIEKERSGQIWLSCILEFSRKLLRRICGILIVC